MIKKCPDCDLPVGSLGIHLRPVRCPFCQLECKTPQKLWEHILSDPECDRWIVMAKAMHERSIARDIAKIWINKESA